MDKRIDLFKKLFESHCTLLNSYYHERDEVNSALIEFAKSFISFVDQLRVKNSPKLFKYVFNSQPDLSNRNVLIAHLFTAKEHAYSIIMRLSENPKQDLINEVAAIIFDYLELINAVEKSYGLEYGRIIGSRNRYVDSYTSYKISSQLFWSSKKLQRSNTLNGFSIFALRQAIELAGREILGLDVIQNMDNTTFKYGSRIPWDFLVRVNGCDYISFSFNPSHIRLIFQWSNQFVHTGKDAFCYSLGLALNVVKDIYKKKEIINWFGQKGFKYVTEITKYDTLKQDFEVYLQNRFLEHPKKAIWKPLPSLATITG